MTIIDAFKAVLWSFFGVRKRSAYEADAKGLKPQHVIAAGLATVVAFVLAIYFFVQLITR